VVAGCVGGLSPRYAAFGRIARGAELLLQLIPAPLAGMLIALAAVFAPRARPLRAARTMLRDASHARGQRDANDEGNQCGECGQAAHGLAPSRRGATL